MNTKCKSLRGEGGNEVELELSAMLKPVATISDARLRNIRIAVLDRIATQPPYRLSDFFGWRVALPAAFSLLLIGAALGWTADQRATDSQEFMLGPVLALGDIE